MRRAGRSTLVALLAVAAIAAVVITSTAQALKSLVTLTATALYMGGTEHPLNIPGDSPAYIDGYVNWAYDSFVGPSGLCTGGNPGCTPVAVYTPAQFWPLTGLTSSRFDASVALGLDNLAACLRGAPCSVTDPPYTTTGTRQLTDSAYTVFGYSQSAAVASMMKSELIAHPPTGTVSFIFESNPNRPNGGILERFVGLRLAILDVTFTGATVTNSHRSTPLTTVDVVHQYDPVGDFPINPLNAIAVANALIGFFYEHPEGGSGTAELQGQYQDSTYYLLPTEILPLIRPLTIVPYLGPLLATVIDPPLRVLVETGYDRTINPGSPTRAKYLYFPNPIDVAVNTLRAIPTGWDNGVAHITGDPTNRPFHTTPQGPFGVGGPPVNTGAIDPYGPPPPASTPVAADPVDRSVTTAITSDPVHSSAIVPVLRPRSAAAAVKEHAHQSDSAESSRADTRRSTSQQRPARGRGRA